ncbi:MAG: DUF2510 domain-containing protein, partial [Candidatus Limnocylindrales bacterium]
MTGDREGPTAEGFSSPARPRADWYADPLRRHALRFFDGQDWTDRVSDAGMTTTDAVDLELAVWLEGRAGDRRSAWPGWVALPSLGVGVVAIIAAGIAAGLADRRGVDPLVTVAIGAGVLYALLLAHCLVIGRAFGSGRGLRFDFAFNFRPADLAWGFAISIAARIAAVLVTLPLAFLDEDLLVPDRDLLQGDEFAVGLLVVTSVVALVLAPILEELFFR